MVILSKRETLLEGQNPAYRPTYGKWAEDFFSFPPSFFKKKLPYFS